MVFGKVVTGMPLLKKLEAVGSDTGKPTCEVKIVDCGEVSDSQNQLKGEKGKKQHKQITPNSPCVVWLAFSLLVLLQKRSSEEQKTVLLLKKGSKPKNHLLMINKRKRESIILLIPIAQIILTHSPQIVARNQNHTLRHHWILAHPATTDTREEKVRRRINTGLQRGKANTRRLRERVEEQKGNPNGTLMTCMILVVLLAYNDVFAERSPVWSFLQKLQELK